MASLISCKSGRVTVAALLMTTVLLQGCTLNMWKSDGWCWWPIARKTDTRIEAAAIDSNHVLSVRVARNHAESEIWAFDISSTSTDAWIEPALATDIPAASVEPVRIMTEDEVEEVRLRRGGVSASGQAGLRVGLRMEGMRGVVTICDRRLPNGVVSSTLPFPPIAWGTPNAIGHVIATPVVAAVDIVLLPVYGLAALCILAGLGH